MEPYLSLFKFGASNPARATTIFNCSVPIFLIGWALNWVAFTPIHILIAALLFFGLLCTFSMAVVASQTVIVECASLAVFCLGFWYYLRMHQALVDRLHTGPGDYFGFGVLFLFGAILGTVLHNGDYSRALRAHYAESPRG